jgi:hypothetical protein
MQRQALIPDTRTREDKTAPVLEGAATAFVGDQQIEVTQALSRESAELQQWRQGCGDERRLRCVT